MKIIMDMLAIQSESSRNRGIGRYSMELSRAIVKQIPEEILLAFSALYEEIEENVFQITQKKDSDINTLQYDILDISNTQPHATNNNELNILLLNRQLNTFAKGGIIHFHSVFEGLGGKGIVLNKLSDLSQVKTVITLYDLIPLCYHDKYLTDPHVKEWYHKKLRLLYDADMLVAISEASKEDAINLLGLPEKNIYNISGAVDKEKFYKMSSFEKEKWEPELLKYGISQKFLLYTGGIDFRKNIKASIEAFSNIDKTLFKTYQYVIVCKISEDARDYFSHIMEKFHIPKEKIIFTGFIDDDLLNYLYNACHLFIFPSIYEGFGLPVLEAMSCGAAVIGSNSSSIPEIIGRQESLFDPRDITDIAQTITRTISNETYLDVLRQHSLKQSELFSWKKSAQQCITAYEHLHNQPIQKQLPLKIAFFSPLPPKRSGISDYSLELLPFLSKYMDIDIYIDDYTVDSDYLKYNYNIYNYTEFESRAEEYQQIIYQFGNSEYHAYMYDIALKYPGVVVLHDFFLSGLVSYMANKEPGYARFFDTLKNTHGEEGEHYYQKIINHKISVGEVIKKFPLNRRIIESASAVIVHSKYAKGLFNTFYETEYPVHKISQIIKTPSIKRVKNKSKARKILGIDDDTIVISAFGHIASSKQYEFILETMHESLLFQEHHIMLYFVGDFMEDAYKNKIENMIHDFKLQDRVKITGFIDDASYQDYMIAADIGINLRMDSRGETSRALLLNMAYALPTIVNDYATFSEFPDATVHKIPLNNKVSFINALQKLISDKAYREYIAENTYAYICKEHNSHAIAHDYYDVLANVISKERDKQDIIQKIATSIVNDGLNTVLEENDYLQIAQIIKKSTPHS